MISTPYQQTATERTVETNQFILTFDNGMETWHSKFGLDLAAALQDFDYLSRQDATSHTIYPATVEILFNDIVIRSYGN